MSLNRNTRVITKMYLFMYLLRRRQFKANVMIFFFPFPVLLRVGVFFFFLSYRINRSIDLLFPRPRPNLLVL